LSEIFKTEAIVIRSSRWSESSKIVHLFTPDKGYIKGIAKGAFQQKSPFRGTLETLNLVEIVVSHKESRGLQLLTSASLQNSFQKIRVDLQKTSIAFSIIELIQQLLRTHEPLPEFFDYSVQLLQSVNDQHEADLRIYLWHFLINISDALGFGWSFGECMVCSKPPTTHAIYLDYENGAIICQNCISKIKTIGFQIKRNHWQFLKTLAETEVQNIEPEFADELPEKQMDYTNILLRHLSYHTDTTIELRSLKWYG
jgi:DNA repair protein RecO (recombination protein O)